MYRVVQDLSVGSLAFSDRDYSYEGLPRQLNGAAYITTSNDDKAEKNFALDLSFNKPATLFVAHDDRISIKPAWLRGFSATGLSVRIAGERHSIFMRSVAADSIIRLGPNSDSPKRKTNMYTVFAK